MTRSAKPKPDLYVAVDVYHYPDGVALPGRPVSITAAQAARGLAAGILIPARPSTPVEQPDAASTAEEE